MRLGAGSMISILGVTFLPGRVSRMRSAPGEQAVRVVAGLGRFSALAHKSKRVWWGLDPYVSRCARSSG